MGAAEVGWLWSVRVGVLGFRVFIVNKKKRVGWHCVNLKLRGMLTSKVYYIPYGCFSTCSITAVTSFFTSSFCHSAPALPFPFLLFISTGRDVLQPQQPRSQINTRANVYWENVTTAVLFLLPIIPLAPPHCAENATNPCRSVWSPQPP